MNDVKRKASNSKVKGNKSNAHLAPNDGNHFQYKHRELRTTTPGPSPTTSACCTWRSQLTSAASTSAPSVLSSDEKYLLTLRKYLLRSALQRPGVPLRTHVHRLRLGNHLRGRRSRQDPPEGGENICKQQEKYLFSYKKYFRLMCPWCLTTTAVTPTARTTLPTP